jgi:hypothetical protein
LPGSTSFIDRHSGTCSGAEKNGSWFSEIVFLKPVSVPSSSFSTVCRSTSVKLLNRLPFQFAPFLSMYSWFSSFMSV